jgi:hypothetical protein
MVGLSWLVYGTVSLLAVVLSLLRVLAAQECDPHRVDAAAVFMRLAAPMACGYLILRAGEKSVRGFSRFHS